MGRLHVRHLLPLTMLDWNRLGTSLRSLWPQTYHHRCLDMYDAFQHIIWLLEESGLGFRYTVATRAVERERGDHPNRRGRIGAPKRIAASRIQNHAAGVECWQCARTFGRRVS